MPNYTHNLSVTWNRTGLVSILQYSVIDSSGDTLIAWTSAGISEPVPCQYRAEVVWDGSRAVTVYWQDDLGRTAQEDWEAYTGRPVAGSFVDLPLTGHNLAVTWNRSGLAVAPAKLQYKVVAADGTVLIDWISAGLQEPVPRQYRAEGVMWKGSLDVTVYWQDDLGRTAQDAINAPVATPAPATTGFSVLDRPLQNVVSTVLGIFGRSAALLQDVTTYNPRTGMRQVSSQQWAVNASPPDGDTATTVNGTVIFTGNFRTVIPAMGARGGPPVEPQAGMGFSWQGVTYEILNAQKLWTGATAAGYQLTCKGGF